MSRSTSKPSRQSGRILIHERDVDDNAPIIGGEEEKIMSLGMHMKPNSMILSPKIWKMIPEKITVVALFV